MYDQTDTYEAQGPYVVDMDMSRFEYIPDVEWLRPTLDIKPEHYQTHFLPETVAKAIKALYETIGCDTIRIYNQFDLVGFDIAENGNADNIRRLCDEVANTDIWYTRLDITPAVGCLIAPLNFRSIVRIYNMLPTYEYQDGDVIGDQPAYYQQAMPKDPIKRCLRRESGYRAAKNAIDSYEEDLRNGRYDRTEYDAKIKEGANLLRGIFG